MLLGGIRKHSWMIVKEAGEEAWSRSSRVVLKEID
jgi:hypothetical protein